MRRVWESPTARCPMSLPPPEARRTPARLAGSPTAAATITLCAARTLPTTPIPTITPSASRWRCRPSPQAEFYVAPNGDDANPGTISQPFLTIEQARQAVRSLAGSMTGDIIVYLRGGEYVLSSSVVLDQLDSGTNGFNVIYQAYPGESPVISGGQAITGWTSVGNNIYKATVPAGFRFRQLYVNKTPVVRARTPNAGSYNRLLSWDIAGRRVEINASEISNWQRLNEVEMVILGGGVNQANLRVESFSTVGSSALVTPQEPERNRIFVQVYPPKAPTRPYWFENAFEFLDAPGEWYLNTQTNEVYYMPRAGEDMATAEVVAPVLETLVRLQGTLSTPIHNVQFYGLTFANTTWLLPSTDGFVGDQASIVFTEGLLGDQFTSYPSIRHPAGVHLEAADHIKFERNIFRDMGSSAINLYVGAHDNQLIGNVISDVSASGISVDLNLESNPADPRKISAGNIIRNNYITRTGRNYFQSVGIMLGYTNGSVVEHNELSDMPYTGISVGWGWQDLPNAAQNNTIRYNDVTHVLNMMDDGGGIYTLSQQPGTLIEENYIHDLPRPTQTAGIFEFGGLYLDQGSNFITMRNNVIANVEGATVKQNQVGSSNTLSNNGNAITNQASIISNAGLEPAYQDIRALVVPLPLPDVTPPDTIITSGPTGTITINSATFNWSGSDNVTPVANLQYAYRLDPIEPSFSAFGVATSASYNGLANGSYTFLVKARDQSGNEDSTPASRTFTVSVDTTPPLRSNGAPTGVLAVGTTQTSLSLTTNENATCRYATAAGVAYGSMANVFTTTGGTGHSTTVSGLTNGGSYSYFVRCQDTVGNANTNDFIISFSVALSSANTTADTTPPVRSNGAPTGTLAAGTTQTTMSLTTNENATLSLRDECGSGVRLNGHTRLRRREERRTLRR